MKTLKKAGGIDLRSANSAADNPIRNESLPAGSTPNQTNPPNDVDEMVSNFLLELNSISHSWGYASDTGNPRKVNPDEVTSGEQEEGSSECIRRPDDDFSVRESRVTVTDLDRRIAGVLDELEREQAKVIPLPLKEVVKPEPAHSPAPGSQAVATQGIQKPSAAGTKPEPSAGLALEATPNCEAVRPAAKPKTRPTVPGAFRGQSSLRQIPAANWLLAPVGLLGVAAATWILMGSPWFGKENLPSVAPAMSAGTVPQALVSESPKAAPASVSETTAANAIPWQPAGSDSRGGVAGIADPQAGTRARSGNSVQASTAQAPPRPDPRVPARTIAAAGGINPQPSEPGKNVIAVQPIPEQSRETPAVEPAPSNAARAIPMIPVPVSPPSAPPAETTVSSVPAGQTPVMRPSADPEIGTSAVPLVSSAGSASAVRERPITPYPAPKPPVAISKITPEYPPLAKRFGISGTVVVSVDVSEDGSVDRAVAVSGPSQLRAAAENALRQWKFTPATQNGIKAKSSLSISVVFNK